MHEETRWLRIGPPRGLGQGRTVSVFPSHSSYVSSCSDCDGLGAGPHPVFTFRGDNRLVYVRFVLRRHFKWRIFRRHLSPLETDCRKVAHEGDGHGVAARSVACNAISFYGVSGGRRSHLLIGADERTDPGRACEFASQRAEASGHLRDCKS